MRDERFQKDLDLDHLIATLRLCLDDIKLRAESVMPAQPD